MNCPKPLRDQYECPFEEPVVTVCCGNTFEKVALDKWMDRTCWLSHFKCPGCDVAHLTFEKWYIRNQALRCNEFAKENALLFGPRFNATCTGWNQARGFGMVELDNLPLRKNQLAILHCTTLPDRDSVECGTRMQVTLMPGKNAGSLRVKDVICIKV